MRRIDIIVSRTSTRAETTERVERYLYDNFTIDDGPTDSETIIVTGEDRAGWTAEAQADRLWSGLIAAKVVG